MAILVTDCGHEYPTKYTADRMDGATTDCRICGDILLMEKVDDQYVIGIDLYDNMGKAIQREFGFTPKREDWGYLEWTG